MCYQFNKYKVLPPTLISKLNNFVLSQQKSDNHAYFFETDDLINSENYDGGCYYICTDNSDNIIGVITAFIIPESVTIYPVINQFHRKKHIFCKLLSLVINDLRRNNYTSLYVSIPRESSEYLSPVISSTGFKYYDSEYLMNYSFLNYHKVDDELEIFFNEDNNEIEIWLDEDYIGGAFLDFDEDDNSANRCVTFYGFEILDTFRHKGYGKKSFKSILNMLSDMGFDKMILHVSGKNKIAHNLYLNCELSVDSSIDVYELNIK